MNTGAHRNKKIIIMLAAVFVFFSPAFAQTPPNLPPLTNEEKSALEQQLAEIENQIQQYQAELKTIQGEKNTLQNKINQLKKQQSSLQLQIKATSLQVSHLESEIEVTQNSIEQNEQKILELKSQLEVSIRALYEKESQPFLYTLVSNKDFSAILDELNSYEQISNSLKGVLTNLNNSNIQLAQEKTELFEQEEDARNLLSIQSLQQQQLVASAQEQNVLLQRTKGKETDYQIVINDTQRRANEIKGRLYELIGIKTQVTFGEAVEIAQWASEQTGVRAAFLLAILTQESNLGKNVGTCNREGDPPSKSYKVIMHPSRDIPPFLKVTQELGRDPQTTPVSCPMKDSRGRQIGWGGAMGPAQFIPSTWMGYKDKVASITGKSADPWDIRDAFLASGLKLAAGGATSVSGEWAAAMRYFSGSTNPRFRFYGDSVVAKANQYQLDIDALN